MQDEASHEWSSGQPSWQAAGLLLAVGLLFLIPGLASATSAWRDGNPSAGFFVGALTLLVFGGLLCLAVLSGSSEELQLTSKWLIYRRRCSAFTVRRRRV